MWDASERTAAIPDNVLGRLAVGGEDSGHLAETARALFGAAAKSSGGRDLLAMGLDAARAAWEAAPLHPLLSRYLLSLDAALGQGVPRPLAPAARAALERLALLCAPPGDMAYLTRLKEKGDPERCARRLLDRIEEEPGRLAYLREYLSLTASQGDFAAQVRVLGRPFPGPLDPVRRRLLAQALAASDRPEAALAACDAGDPLFSPGCVSNFRALCLAAMGDREGAAREAVAAIAARPWACGPYLRLHDLVFDPGAGPARSRGASAVLFYAFDKPGLLERALAAVGEADPAPDMAVVLDNGGPDAIGQAARAFGERFGKERFDFLRLPVNVGAPAARNWLIRHVLAKWPGRFETLVFLDDDAYVPRDFLARLGAAMAAYPEAGVWGCKTVNAGQPRTVQHADGHLLPLGPPDQAQEGAREEVWDEMLDQAASFALYRPQAGTPDIGQFAYMRPCSTVTGCCHAFKASLFSGNALFDLQFSPSQYDDLDHDLALAEAGSYAVYQGHLTVRHDKSTGLGQGLSPNAAGNMLKLFRKWPERRASALRVRLNALLVADLAAKRARLAGAGLLS